MTPYYLQAKVPVPCSGLSVGCNPASLPNLPACERGQDAWDSWLPACERERGCLGSWLLAKEKNRPLAPISRGRGSEPPRAQSHSSLPPGISLIMWNALYTAEKVIIRWTLLTEACYFSVQFLGES